VTTKTVSHAPLILLYRSSIGWGNDTEQLLVRYSTCSFRCDVIAVGSSRHSVSRFVMPGFKVQANEAFVLPRFLVYDHTVVECGYSGLKANGRQGPNNDGDNFVEYASTK
jgi:hypothetical protein